MLSKKHCLISVVFSATVALVLPCQAAQQMERTAPEVHGSEWINAAPLSIDKLKGQVVLVEFWTFGCYNCTNVEPFIKNWHRKYADQGLTIIGVHTPEFDYEKNADNVRGYVRQKAIEHAVLIDNTFSTWRAYNNRAWPALYLIDKQGIIRYKHVGEGAYQTTEEMIQKLLKESYPERRS